MSEIGKKERETQDRVIALFRSELDYRYLGNWEKREDNSNIEKKILTDWLTKKGCSQNLIGKAYSPSFRAVNGIAGKYHFFCL